jgi:amino acid transporter
MSRIVYSMANDGLLLNFLSNVNSKFKTPTFAILLTGFFSSVLTLLIDLNQMIEMMSIGTLMAYTVVSLCVIILRYRPSIETNKDDFKNEQDSGFFLYRIFKDTFIKKFDKCCPKTARNANISVFFCSKVFCIIHVNYFNINLFFL